MGHLHSCSAGHCSKKCARCCMQPGRLTPAPGPPRDRPLQAEGPKTIEEIHREEAMKRTRSAMLDRQASGRDSFRGPRGGPPPGCAPAVWRARLGAPRRRLSPAWHPPCRHLRFDVDLALSWLCLRNAGWSSWLFSASAQRSAQILPLQAPPLRQPCGCAHSHHEPGGVQRRPGSRRAAEPSPGRPPRPPARQRQVRRQLGPACCHCRFAGLPCAASHADIVRVGCCPPQRRILGLLCKSRIHGTWHAGCLPPRPAGDLQCRDIPFSACLIAPP